MKEELKKKAGITLIALVLTIIVLLILAGVSIATLTGENGILTRASKAEEKTEEATEEEQRKLAMLEAATNTKNTTFEGVTIPAGFAPTKIEGESTIKDGLVITDSEGNEFVWIPVENINDMIMCKSKTSTEDDQCNIALDGNILKCTEHDNNTNICGRLYATSTGEKFNKGLITQT